MRTKLLAVLVLLPLAVLAQEYRSTISGTVTDAAGASVPNAKVLATELRTGVKSSTVSNGDGQYTIPFLAPGSYRITAELAGFKRYVRDGVQLGAGEHPQIDLRLDVGDVAVSVNVTAEIPLLNTENSSTGQAITTKEVEDLPLNGRTPIMLAQLAIGVIPTGPATVVHPFDNGSGGAFVIGGSVAQTSELLLNGSPNATWDMRLAYSPPQEAVQEVIVKAFDSDAAYGHTGGGTLNQIMKTGTNGFHGALYEFGQPSNMTANNFFNNQKGLGNPVTHFNQYGMAVGGPVFIPKVYDGRNKLFWFVAWERLPDAQPNTNFATVPTDAERKGDFSALLSLPKGSQYQIYNPYSATLSGTTITRQPFPNNIIPPALLNKVAMSYLQFYPEPNVPNASATGFGNYGNANNTTDNYSNQLGRLDYNMSDRSRMSFDVRHNTEFQLKNNYFGNVSTGNSLIRDNWGASLDEVYTLNPTAVLDARLNFTRLNEVRGEPSAGFDQSTIPLGFPSSMFTSSTYRMLPVIQFSGSCGSQTTYQCLGDTSGPLRYPSQSLQLFASVVKSVGHHTLKFGTDLRQYRLNSLSYGVNSAGGFTFSNNYTRASSTSSAVAMGQDFASFLMGLPTSGQFDLNAAASYKSYYYAVFLQDDWRVKRNLTVNLGIRYDRDNPYSEKYGRSVNGFDTTSPSPIAAAATAAYAKNPISQLPVGGFGVRGGLTFADPNNTSIYQNTSHLISPRIGFAWSPDLLHGKTVIRGGFGMFVQPITIANLAITGNYSSSPIVAQEGFSQATPIVASNDNFLTPTTKLDNPFPSGFQQPVGSAQGLGTYLGQTINFLNPNAKSPYALRWNIGFQHSITPSTILEVVYIGNHSVHLPLSVTQLNGIPRQFLSTYGAQDANQAYLAGTATNPFAGLNPAGTINGKTVSVAQLLAHYPQFPVGDTASGWTGSGGILEDNLNVGSSYFQSLNVRLQKRLSQGLSLVGNFIYSRLIERDDWLNASDPQPEKRISPFDHPFRFVTAAVYELPFGKKSSHLTKQLIGGWRVTGFYTIQQGAPFIWVNGSSTTPGDYVFFGGPGQLTVDNRNANANTPSFNTALFQTNSTQTFQYHLRTFSTTFPNLRQDGINNFDTSVLKNFDIRENMYFQLRFEVFNLANHASFGAPNTAATNAQFGQITTQANRPRTIQIGGRFVF